MPPVLRLLYLIFKNSRYSRMPHVLKLLSLEAMNFLDFKLYLCL